MFLSSPTNYEGQSGNRRGLENRVSKRSGWQRQRTVPVIGGRASTVNKPKNAGTPLHHASKAYSQVNFGEKDATDQEAGYRGQDRRREQIDNRQC